MNHLHYEVNAGPSDVIKVILNSQANVKLMDSSNYQRYKAGGQHKYQGGLAKASPFHLSPPCNGNWHVTVDLGGYSGKVNASVSVI